MAGSDDGRWWKQWDGLMGCDSVRGKVEVTDSATSSSAQTQLDCESWPHSVSASMAIATRPP